MMGLKAHAQTSFYQNAVEFWIYDDTSGKRAHASEITLETPEHEGLLIAPTFRLPLDNTQELFEELWKQGFRSAHDKGNSAALDVARTEHIADLRKAAKLA